MPTLSYIRLGAPVIPGDLPAAITGVWASAEAPDYADMAGMVITAGIWSSTEAPDIAAFSAPVPVTGTWSSLEAADAVAIAGGVAWPEITGAWSSGEAGDSAVISGSVTTTGAWASTEAPDVAAFSAPVPLETQLATLLSPGATKLEIMWPDPQYWYQDVAGTVPVTAEGQPVRCWRSLAGTSYTQPTNADYAPLASKLPNGAWALSYDGVDDWLQSAANIDLSASDGLTLQVGMRRRDNSIRMLVEVGVSYASPGGFYLIGESGSRVAYSGRAGRSGAINDAAYADVTAPDVSHVFTATQALQSGSGSKIRRNGVQEGVSVSTDFGAGNFASNLRLNIGARNSGTPGTASLRYYGYLGPLVLRGGPLPDLATIEAAEAIINQHMGAY